MPRDTVADYTAAVIRDQYRRIRELEGLVWILVGCVAANSIAVIILSILVMN